MRFRFVKNLRVHKELKKFATPTCVGAGTVDGVLSRVGCVLFPDGVFLFADGVFLFADGVFLFAYGVFLFADGVFLFANGVFLFADGVWWMENLPRGKPSQGLVAPRFGRDLVTSVVLFE